MANIKIVHKGDTLENSVFEKSEISIEFTPEAIERFIGDLSVAKAETEGALQKLEVMIDKAGVKDADIPINSKHYADFASFVDYSNQIKIALKRLEEISEEYPKFHELYEELTEDQKNNMSKAIRFRMQRAELEADLEVNNSELEKYNADLETAKGLWDEE